MNFKSKVVSIIGAGMILFGSASGIAAQAAGIGAPVSVEVAVDGGVLAIESVEESEAFDTIKVNQNFEDSSTTSGAVSFQVRDARFTRAGWSVNISATDFTSNNGYDVSVENLSVSAITVTTDAGEDGPEAASTPFTMSAALSPMVVGAPAGTGSGLYTVKVATSLTIPANTTIGTYTSTITFNLGTAP